MRSLLLWTNGTTLEASSGTITIHDDGVFQWPVPLANSRHMFPRVLLWVPHTTLDASKPFGVIVCLHVWAIVSG